MKPVFLALMAVLVGAALLQAGNQRGVSITNNDDSLSDDCSQHMQIHSSEYHSVLRGEEVRSLPNQPLNFIAEQNGGIQVSTWDRPEFSVKLCKQVASDDDSQGRNVLAQTTLSVEGNTVSVKSGAHEGEYSLGTLLLVHAPKDANVTMKVSNGGISLNHFTGTADAHAQNGGIALKNSSGTLKLTAENGGISIRDSSGDINAEVENGGLSISVPQHWEGKGLQAHTQNGGLTLNVPRSFNGSMEVSGSNHTSIICKGDSCDSAQRTWDEGHRILKFGSGEPQIRASTVNGGIVIHTGETGKGSL